MLGYYLLHARLSRWKGALLLSPLRNILGCLPNIYAADSFSRRLGQAFSKPLPLPSVFSGASLGAKVLSGAQPG